MQSEEIKQKPKLIRYVNHELWTKTVKRARRVEGLLAHELIEKLFNRYNEDLDRIIQEASEEPATQE